MGTPGNQIHQPCGTLSKESQSSNQSQPNGQQCVLQLGGHRSEDVLALWSSHRAHRSGLPWRSTLALVGCGLTLVPSPPFSIPISPFQNGNVGLGGGSVGKVLTMQV